MKDSHSKEYCFWMVVGLLLIFCSFAKGAAAERGVREIVTGTQIFRLDVSRCEEIDSLFLVHFYTRTDTTDEVAVERLKLCNVDQMAAAFPEIAPQNLRRMFNAEIVSAPAARCSLTTARALTNDEVMFMGRHKVKVFTKAYALVGGVWYDVSRLPK